MSKPTWTIVVAKKSSKAGPKLTTILTQSQPKDVLKWIKVDQVSPQSLPKGIPTLAQNEPKVGPESAKSSPASLTCVRDGKESAQSQARGGPESTEGPALT